MKNWIIILILFQFYFVDSIAQVDEFGILIGSNFSDQSFLETNQDEEYPFGSIYRFGSNYVSGLNVGIYGLKKISKRWELRSSLNFQQKGRIEYAKSNQLTIFAIDPTQNKLEHQLSYLTFGVFIDHVFNPSSNKFKFAIFSGVENNFFLSERIIESELIETFTFYPRSEYEDKWNPYNLSYSLGFRLRIYDLLGISVYLNNSLSAALKTQNLEVKNHTFGFSLDVNLLKIIKG